MEKNTAIFNIRTQLDLKQRQMSVFLNVEQSNYSLIETGVNRRLNAEHIKRAEIHLKANPDYLRYQIGQMFTTEKPLYSQRIKEVCSLLRIIPEHILNDIEDLAIQERFKQVLTNNEAPDYDLLKQAFKKYEPVNYNYLLDAKGDPLKNNKLSNLTESNNEISKIALEAISAFKKLIAEREKQIEDLQTKLIKANRTIEILSKKVKEDVKE